jgi:hypothetical protein
VIIRRMAVIQPRAKLFQHHEPPIYRTFRQIPPDLVKAIEENAPARRTGLAYRGAVNAPSIRAIRVPVHPACAVPTVAAGMSSAAFAASLALQFTVRRHHGLGSDA